MTEDDTSSFAPGDRDPLIERVRHALRESPAATPDPRAIAQLLSAAYAAPRPGLWRRALDTMRMTTFTRLGALAAAAGAVVFGFVLRDAVPAKGEGEPMASSGPATGEYPVQVAAATAGDGSAMVPTQFVFEERDARRVSLVGEFNDWKAGATPLTRLKNGVWTVTLPLTPGRHVYAFVLDDTLVVADPRAPKAGDADYGREGSVVMVFAR